MRYPSHRAPGQHVPMTDLTGRLAAHHAVAPLTHQQDGVISRRQLRELGISRWRVRAEVRAGRWRAHHKQTIATHTGELSARAQWWYGVFESGSRGVLDGASSLAAAGLRGFEVDHIRISVPRGTKVLKAPGVVVRQTRRLKNSDINWSGLPRVRPEIAAVRAALWAVSDKQAALILSMAAQQGIAKPDDIGLALLDVHRDRRRRFLHRVVLDLVGGAQAISEQEFAHACRRRGMPPPDRQVLRRSRSGCYYLDNYWGKYHLVVEVDGIHHLYADAVVNDALRQNDISLSRDIVLRVPLLGLRIAEQEFFGQIEAALVDGGWRRSQAA